MQVELVVTKTFPCLKYFVAPKDEVLERLNSEKALLEEKLETERKDMEQQMKQLEEKLKEQATTREAEEEEWKVVDICLPS